MALDERLPAGWMIRQEWIPNAYDHDLMWQVYHWGSKMQRDHWWSKAKKRTGWFPYGEPFVFENDAINFVLVTYHAINAQGATK